MKLVVIGCGYVGVTTAACLAKAGHDVVCVDRLTEKIHSLKEGRLPFAEPGLESLLSEQLGEGRLQFLDQALEHIQKADGIFLAVGTPHHVDGGVDLSDLREAMGMVVESLSAGPKDDETPTLIVVKSTVPPGTVDRFNDEFESTASRQWVLCVNPEFLRQGSAVEDFQNPHRVVVGVPKTENGQWASAQLRSLYEPILSETVPFISVDIRSAEFAKYAANAYLALRLSFINEIAEMAGHLGADIRGVGRVLSSDPRIGGHYLQPGVGYGGSCLPKDLQALIDLSAPLPLDGALFQAVSDINNRQQYWPVKTLERHVSGGSLKGMRIAIFGLSFKPHTDDMRHAPSQGVIEALLERGCEVWVYDPKAMDTARGIFGNRVHYGETPEASVRNTNGLIVLTEWPEFKEIDLDSLVKWLATPLIIDGRGVFDGNRLSSMGVAYYSVGLSQ